MRWRRQWVPGVIPHLGKRVVQVRGRLGRRVRALAHARRRHVPPPLHIHLLRLPRDNNAAQRDGNSISNSRYSLSTTQPSNGLAIRPSSSPQLKRWNPIQLFDHPTTQASAPRERSSHPLKHSLRIKQHLPVERSAGAFGGRNGEVAPASRRPHAHRAVQGLRGSGSVKDNAADVLPREWQVDTGSAAAGLEAVEVVLELEEVSVYHG